MTESDNDDLDGDDPTQWGNAELGAPKPDPATTKQERRAAPGISARRELAERARAHLASMHARPPWPGKAKSVPDVLPVDDPKCDRRDDS